MLSGMLAAFFTVATSIAWTADSFHASSITRPIDTECQEFTLYLHVEIR